MHTDINANLLIHYTLQQVFDRKVNNMLPDSLQAGVIEGLDPMISKNDMLGWALAFEEAESYIKLPALDFAGLPTMSVSFWYQSNALNSLDSTVFCLASKNVNGDDTVWLSLKNTLDGDILLSIHDPAIELVIEKSPGEKLRHFALVIAADKIQVFLDTTLMATKVLDAPLALGTYNNAMLGNIYSAMPSQFAQFRLYSRALSEEEVKLLHFSDLKEGSELNLMLNKATPDELDMAPALELGEAPLAPTPLKQDAPAALGDTADTGPKPLKLLLDPGKTVSLLFDGTSSNPVELPFNPVKEDGLSLETWINVAPELQSCVLLGLSSTLGDFYLYIEDGFVKAEMGPNKVQLAKVQPDKWYHLALVINALGLLQVYLDGYVLKTKINFAMGMGGKVDVGLALGKVFGLSAAGEEAKLLLGGDKNKENLFLGRIDQLKLYNNLLQEDQIRQSILDAQAQNTLLKNKPAIELDIFTIDQDNSFHILNSDSKNILYVKVANTTIEDIACTTLTKLNAEQYHLLLRFRQSTLSADTLKKLAAAKPPTFIVTDATGQKIAECTYRVGYDATDYVDWLAIQFPAGFVIPKNAAVQLAIPDVAADKAGGARNTRVELGYANLVPENQVSSISRTVLQLLEVQSHLGITPVVANISPYNVFLIGESKEQSFDITVKPRSSTAKIICSNNPAKPTRFLVTLPDHVSFGESGFEINCKTPGFRVEPPAAGQKIWAFVCEDNLHLTIESPLEIQVSKWKPSQVTPNENLSVFLEHRNLEGYKDDVIRLPIHFSNLLQREDKIGIGTDKPQAKLHVKGDARVEGDLTVEGKAIINNELSLGDSMKIAKNLTVEGTFMPRGLIDLQNKPLRLLLDYGGDAFIFKAYSYDIKGMRDAFIQYRNSRGLFIGIDDVIDETDPERPTKKNNNILLGLYETTHNGCFEVRPHFGYKQPPGGTGNTGIPLRVFGRGSLSQQQAAYYARHTNGKESSYGHWSEALDLNDISIYAEGRVLATEFNAFSDARIKDVQARLSPEEALETIQKLQVTQYTYKDTVTKGHRPKLGFIAQELETAMPNTVSYTRDYVPSIMAMSQSLHFDEALGILSVTMAQPHALNDDAQVKLVFETKELTPKVKVISPNTFSLPYEDEWPVQQVFVYGEEVSDFRTVDHDQINALSVAAIQQLIHQNNQLKQQLDAVLDRITRLESLIQ